MKIQFSIKKLFLISLIALTTEVLSGQTIDLSRASISISEKINSPVRETAAKVLQEEIAQRTSITIKLNSGTGRSPVIVLARKDDARVDGFAVPKRIGKELSENNAEGFRICLDSSNGRDILWLIGADERGIIFALGQFLRTAFLSKNKITFNKSNEIATSPEYSIRGHQLGYRNTANSWDAWTVNQYEKYIRELALFGANSIENIPFQDGPAGPNMKVSREEMNSKMSEICNNYGLDYWIWTPADVDLADSAIFRSEVRKHSEFYKNCPRLDGVFFPGGDPGNNHPRFVLPFLKEISAELKKYHPKAGIWISLQGFNDDQVDYFYEYLEKNDPDWLTGVVSGPGSPDIAATRYRLPKKYKLRNYPDITHTVRCQYPVLNLDQAYALTEGREVCNPRPFFYAKTHNRFARFTDGFISYSDGVHDDVNKAIWSQMAWDQEKDIREVLVEYSHLFFGSDVAEEAAAGILALERNWDGAIEENGSVETTFAFWQNLESKHPELKGNWRWQQLVMRSYYDTYTQRRKMFEQNLEKEANLMLSRAEQIGSSKAMDEALAIVNKADKEPVFQSLRQKVFEYCEDLFQSIGMQTSVKKYNASGAERGAILDFIDYPLNNRWWLADEFDKIRNMSSEKEKLERLEIIRTWENPGPGSFYDNVSDLSKGTRVTTRSDDGTDVAWWDNGMSRRRLSTQLFQSFPVLIYNDLDPKGHYIIRISGYGDALLRVDGERIDPAIYNKGLEEFKEFHLAQKYVSDGKIEVTFDQPEESHLNWRQHSKICDIWLLKQ